MGMYTTVFKNRECLRCGAKYLCAFQIKTGEDRCANYKDGDLAPNKDFAGCKGAHRAAYHPICDVCEAFIRRELEELEKASKEIVLHSGLEIRQVGYKSHIFKNGRRIGELGFGGQLSSVDRSREFRILENAIFERLVRQIRASALDGYIQIERGWKKNLWPMDDSPREYRLQVQGPYYCNTAEVMIGKRFRIKVVEPHTRDPRKYLEACCEEGK